MDWDDFDDEDGREDCGSSDANENPFLGFLRTDNLENLYSEKELCHYVKEAIEAKHGVKITEISYCLGVFTFSVSTSGIEDISIPFHWTPISFGKDTVSFTIPLDVFERDYYKIEGRDFNASVEMAMKKVFGEYCDILSVGSAEDSLFGGVEVVVRMKKGSMLSFKNLPWLPMSWVQDDLIAFNVDDNNLRDLLEA